MEAQARKRSRQEARATEAETAAAAPAAYRDRQYCPDCRRVTEALVVDYGRTDVMCTECERILVGPFLAIDIPRDAVGAAATPKNKRRRRRGKASASTDEGFDAAISGMADRLGLTAAVGDRAKEVYKKMEEANAWPRCQGWNTDRSRGPLYAACVAVACRNEGSPRTLKELASAVADGAAPATRCDIGRLTKHIRKRLGEEEAGQATGIGMVRVSSYLRRFCPLLGMGDPEASAAWMAARRLDEDDLEVRHTAESVAAGVVCLALERAGAKDPVVKDVSAATGVSTTTIYAVRQKLLPRADLLFG